MDNMIPMIDLKGQFEELREELLSELAGALEGAQYVLGPKVREFEEKVSDYCGVSESVGVASGTDALHLALRALGVGEDDEVITTPFTFFSTVEAIIYTGAKPVFVDIDARSFNIDAAKIEEKITGRTKAVIPVHMFGHPADMAEIMEIAQRRGLRVVEDCAQAFGASINGHRVGGFGDAGCFSFYPSKNLGACGDAGMVSLRESDTARQIRKLRNHGSITPYIHEFIGFNSRLDEIQAAILLVKFKRIEKYNALRRRKAALYNELLSGNVLCPTEKDGFYHVYHQYTVRLPGGAARRDALKARLAEAKIASNVYYPLPMHLQRPVMAYGYGKGDFAAAETVSDEVLSLPMYPELDESAIERIAGIVLSA